MLDRIADLALSRPRALLAANVAVAAAAIGAALGAPGDLGVGSTRLDEPAPHELVVVLSDTEAAGESVVAVARRAVSAQLAADPRVGEPQVADDASTPRRSVLVAELTEGSAVARERTVEDLRASLDPGPLRIDLGGETAALIDARAALGGELWQLALLALPALLLLAALAVGPRLALAPVLCAVISIAGALALMRLAGVALDISLLGVVPAAVAGTVLGFELPALVARIHRDEAALADAGLALRRTVERAGPSLLAASLAATIPALALLVAPLAQAPSLILGCALGAALAAAVALTATPSLIAIAGGLVPTGEGGEPRRGLRGATATLRRVPGLLASSAPVCALAALAALAVALALALPALEGTTRPFAAGDLPPDSEALRAAALPSEPGAVGGSLLGELPLVGAVAAGLLALSLAAATRRPGALVATPLILAPAAAGLGVCVHVLDQGGLAHLLGTEGRGTLDTAAVAAGLAALASIAAARTAIALRAVRAERRLGIGPDGAAELAGGLTLPGAAAATLAGAALAGTLVSSELAVAREAGLIVASGLVADLLLARLPCLAALARWSAS